MESATRDNSQATTDLLARLREGDGHALAELFARHEGRLRRMVRLRLAPRLRGHIESAQVLRDVYREADSRVGEYLDHPSIPFFLWLRALAGQRLQALHQQHLGTGPEEGREVCLYGGALPPADSAALAAQLLGKMAPAAEEARRAEVRLRLQQALNGMDPLDREVLVLRHFEELSNNETAQVLGLDPPAAGQRYLRALKRLKDTLAAIPGLWDRGRR